jgi:hypothetical protein
LQKTALLCWEIGEALGHLTNLRTIALSLKGKGYRCVFAVRELTYAFEILHTDEFEIFQAPRASISVTGLASMASYAEILMLSGFVRPKILAGQLLAWRSLFRAISPTLLLLDSAPSAMLASRGLDIQTVITASGFGCPPDTPNWPAFPSHQKVSPERLRSSELAVLQTANDAARSLGIRELEHIGQLYPAEKAYIATVPELDHYVRSDAEYIGSLAVTELGVAPNWPVRLGRDDSQKSLKSIFAYLKADYLGLETVLEVLAKSDTQTVAFIPGLADSLQRKWNGANLWISTEPIHVQQALSKADFFLGHGGSLIQPVLLAGVPLILLPMQTEQTMASQVAHSIGAAAVCTFDGLSNFKRIFKNALNEPNLKTSAQAFAQRNSKYLGTEVFDAFIDKITVTSEA